ncbi:MAG: hypothetical protein AAF939_18115 [Planctomycetota bacterium]
MVDVVFYRENFELNVHGGCEGFVLMAWVKPRDSKEQNGDHYLGKGDLLALDLHSSTHERLNRLSCLGKGEPLFSNPI